MKRTYLIPLAVGLLTVFMTIPVSAASDEELDEMGNYIYLDDNEYYADSDINRSADSIIEPNFGVAERQYAVIYSGSCTPIRSIYTYDQYYGWRWSTTGASSWFDCSADIPQGAKMLGVGVEAYDNDGSADVDLIFIESLFLEPTGTYYSNSTSGASSSSQYLTVDLSSDNITINYVNNSYGVRIGVGGDFDTQFRSVDFRYQLQISPAPATATFNDVQTSHTFFKEVEALTASGITGGCGGGNYCPDSNVTRGQMAAFLSRALGLHFW